MEVLELWQVKNYENMFNSIVEFIAYIVLLLLTVLQQHTLKVANEETKEEMA